MISYNLQYSLESQKSYKSDEHTNDSIDDNDHINCCCHDCDDEQITRKKNKIIELLPPTYLQRVIDIMPYNDYYQPLVRTANYKSPTYVLVLNPFYNPSCDEIRSFNVNFIKRCRTRKK